MYKVLRSVFAPEKPVEVLYADLMKKVQEAFHPGLTNSVTFLA